MYYEKTVSMDSFAVLCYNMSKFRTFRRSVLKHNTAIRTSFSAPTAPVCCVLLNHNTTVFLNHKALPTNAVKAEKSSTLNEEILSFIKAKDAGGLTPIKDDNEEKG